MNEVTRRSFIGSIIGYVGTTNLLGSTPFIAQPLTFKKPKDRAEALYRKARLFVTPRNKQFKGGIELDNGDVIDNGKIASLDVDRHNLVFRVSFEPIRMIKHVQTKRIFFVDDEGYEIISKEFRCSLKPDDSLNTDYKITGNC